MVRDGFTKETVLKVRPVYEEGASGAKIWGRVVQPEEAAGANALQHKVPGCVLQREGQFC